MPYFAAMPDASIEPASPLPVPPKQVPRRLPLLQLLVAIVVAVIAVGFAFQRGAAAQHFEGQGYRSTSLAAGRPTRT